MLNNLKLLNVIEALLYKANKPISISKLRDFFTEEPIPTIKEIKSSLQEIQKLYKDRGIELVEVASGYRFQIPAKYSNWVGKLVVEKTTRYSRALLETLALIAYRQPITRGEIEDIRGVAVSTSIIKTLLEERKWIRVIGHRDVPGKPSLFATTQSFLDDLGLKNIVELPPLPEKTTTNPLDGNAKTNNEDKKQLKNIVEDYLDNNKLSEKNMESL